MSPYPPPVLFRLRLHLPAAMTAIGAALAAAMLSPQIASSQTTVNVHSSLPDASMGLPPTVAPDAKVEKLAALPTESYTVGGKPFTEGTTCAPNGDVYFIEQNSDKILRWSVADRRLSVFMHPCGYSNGMSFDRNGDLIACADERNELWAISTTATETVPYPRPLNPAVGDPARPATLTRPAHTVLVKDYRGRLLNGPNDVWVRPDGGMYLTDPYYARAWWAPGRKPEQELKTVYFLSPDRKTLTRVLDRFDSPDGSNGTPNGIAGTPDGRTLYVSDISGRRTFSYAIHADGALTNETLLCPFGSDGMTLDDRGNLYMSVGGTHPPGVTVVATNTGRQIGFIPMPEAPANMCFGGRPRDTLFICARTGFYCIRTLVTGANPAK